MKKIVLSLAGVLAATAFAPEASAIPAFARQTGMACQACHFQHFPQLNAFGRSFKNSGFTMIGAQGKIEGEHLSIPDTLNMSMLITAGYEDVSNSGKLATAGVAAPTAAQIAAATAAGVAPAVAVPATAGTKNGAFFFPNGGGELSLFVAGRISENIGFLTELAGSIGGSPIKVPMLWDVGGVRAGLVLVTGNHPAWSFETLNTGATSTHRMMGNAGPRTGLAQTKTHISVTGAAQYLGTSDIKGHGVSGVVNGDWGFVNLGKYDLTAAMQAGSSSNAMSTTYARGAYIFNAGGWDAAVGIQSFSGSAGAATLVVAAQDSKATIIDGQMQGEVGGMPLGVYASYGRAPTAINGNVYNTVATMGGVGSSDRKSFNIAAELGVIPHKATLQLAFRSAKNGLGSAGAAGGIGDKDNAIMIGGVYELAQNVGLYLTHTSQSGSAWNTPNAAGAAAIVAAGGVLGANGAPVGKNVTSFTLEANF